MDQKELVKEIINTIEEELNQSSEIRYVCKDNSIISSDVRCVKEWFNEYKYVLRERYKI